MLSELIVSETMTKTPISKVGKGNTLFYALIVGAFITWQSIFISYSKEDGLIVRTQPVPLSVLAPCLVFIAAALGINLKEEIVLIAAAVSRNSAAITALAEQAQQQQQQHQEIEQLTDTKNDDSQEL